MYDEAQMNQTYYTVVHVWLAVVESMVKTRKEAENGKQNL